MQTSMDDMLKTLHATQASHKETQRALNDATDQNRKLSSEMVKYMEFYMDERKQREALESENRRMKKLLELYHSNGATAEEAKIIKGKHFSRSSEKGKTSSVDVNSQEEEHDFDGTNPPKDVDSTTEPIATKNELDSKSCKQRIDHAKNTYGADEIVEHFSDVNVLPAGYRIIETRLVREFEHIEKVVDERSQCFVNLIGNLYWIESMIKLKQLSADEARKERKEKATSILIELKSRLQQIADDPLTVYSESLRKAVTYALTFWKQTTLYIEHGDWNIDNNAVERSMRPLAVGRKNFVGFGSHQGASLGACAYTLVETCKLNTISAYEYIKKVLTLIGDEKEDTNNYSDLIPSILTVK